MLADKRLSSAKHRFQAISLHQSNPCLPSTATEMALKQKKLQSNCYTEEKRNADQYLVPRPFSLTWWVKDKR
jgi:hypothetical protein